MKTIRINEGVNIRLIEDNKFSFYTMAILFRTPLKKETVTANSLLALTLLGGSEGYRDRRVIEIALEEMEGAILTTSVIKKGNEHIIQLFTRFKPKYTQNIVSLIADIIYNPLFRNKHNERNNLKNIIEAQINDKRSLALNNFFEKIYNQPNGDGYVDEIYSINIENHYNNIINNSVIEIMIVGDSNVANCVKNYFDFKDRIASIEMAKKLKPYKNNVIDSDKTIQSKICIGLDCDFTPKGVEYIKTLIANEILGGSNSILFNEAREKKGLCYYVTSSVYRFNSIICIEAGIDYSKKDSFIEIVKNLSLKYIKKDDIEKAKYSIVNNYLNTKDSPEGILNFYINQIIANDNSSIDDVIDIVKSVDNIDGFNSSLDTVYILRGEK